MYLAASAYTQLKVNRSSSNTIVNSSPRLPKHLNFGVFLVSMASLVNIATIIRCVLLDEEVDEIYISGIR